MSGENLVGRQQLAQSAVAPGVNVVVTGVRPEDGKTIARVEPVRPQLQQTGGTPGGTTPQMAG